MKPPIQGGPMKAFLATVLSVIAVGVLLIAYGLLAPRASAAAQATPVMYDPQTGAIYQVLRPAYAGDRLPLPESVNAPFATPSRVSAPAGYTPAVYSAPVE